MSINSTRLRYMRNEGHWQQISIVGTRKRKYANRMEGRLIMGKCKAIFVDCWRRCFASFDVLFTSLKQMSIYWSLANTSLLCLNCVLCEAFVALTMFDVCTSATYALYGTVRLLPRTNDIHIHWDNVLISNDAFACRKITQTQVYLTYIRGSVIWVSTCLSAPGIISHMYLTGKQSSVTE